MRRSTRPILASAALKEKSPRKMSGSGFLSANRYAPLASRDTSPATSVASDSDFRARSQSIKRKNTEDYPTSYANVTSGNLDGPTGTVNPAPKMNVEKLTVDITKTKSLCDAVKTDLARVDMQPEVACMLNNLCEAISLLSDVQSEIVAANNNQYPAQGNSGSAGNTNFVSLGAISKKPRQDLGCQILPPVSRTDEWIPARSNRQSKGTGRNAEPVEPDENIDPKIQKFKETIKESERATLCFNLDMGRVPIMNKDTMNRKATLSLASMAAKLEKKTGDVPSKDAIDAIDDLLSVTTGMQLYGATTKTYRSPNDPNSGLYCTVPVRYEFESKDDRVRAEKILRDKCGVSCTTPYPVLVRECIKQIVSNLKPNFNNHAFRVNIDCQNLSFKVATKEKCNKDEVREWVPYGKGIPIPEAALDVSIRRVPENFKLPWPVASPQASPQKSPQKHPSPRKNSRDSEGMDTQSTAVAP
jgi:hypothetical protein